ncbi:hypothetical protein TNCV_2212031 [Trichonephila clavipes]|nr:hypothetical protein TNCV_2212031 [Trichonephila clavipes]
MHLTINQDKTKFISSTGFNEPYFVIGEYRFEAVNGFSYLGSKLNTLNGITPEEGHGPPWAVVPLRKEERKMPIKWLICLSAVASYDGFRSHQCRLKLISGLGCRSSTGPLGTGGSYENLVKFSLSESLGARSKNPMDKPALGHIKEF